MLRLLLLHSLLEIHEAVKADQGPLLIHLRVHHRRNSSRLDLGLQDEFTLPVIDTATINTNRGGGNRSFVNRDTSPQKSAPNSVTSNSVTRLGGKEYNMSDPAQVKALNAAIAAERKARPNQKSADLRGGQTSVSESNSKPEVPLRSSTGRSDPPPRRNPNGINQTGTNTGFKTSGFAEANGLLESLGINGPRYGEFQSTKLSTGADAPSDREAFGGSKAESQAIEAGGSVETVIGPNTDPITTIKTEGGANLTQSGGVKTTNPVNPEPETSVLGSRARYNQEFSAQDSNLKGLRAAEASKGCFMHQVSTGSLIRTQEAKVKRIL